MSGFIKSFNQVVEVTPTITAGAYSAEDQVGGIQTLSGATLGEDCGATVISVVVTDKAKQSAALSMFFFDELPTVASADNDAINISDAEMADKCIGVISVAAASYVNVADNSVVTAPASSTGLYVKSRDADGKIYVVVKTTGTPTYASTGDLVFKYSFLQD
jgi:hypothetical protein